MLFVKHIAYLNEICIDLEKKLQVNLDAYHFKLVTNTFFFYSFKFDDILEIQRDILLVIKKHHKQLSIDWTNGLLQYCKGLLKGKYIADGFTNMGGATLEMAVLPLAKKIKDKLIQDFPDDAGKIADFEIMMNKIQGSYYVASRILKLSGNGHTETLKPVLLNVEPVFKNMILKSLSVNYTHSQVKNLFHFYISYYDNLLTNSNNKEVKALCKYLINNAKEHLLIAVSNN